MEVLGVAFTLLNSVVIITLSIYRKTSDLLIEAKKSIADEFSICQKNFGNTFSNYAIEESPINDATDRLKRIVFSGHLDIHIIKIFSRELLLMIIFALIGVLLSLVSLVKGFFTSGNSSLWSLRTSLILGIPIIILVFELFILCRSLFIEKRAKEIKNKYRTREY